MKSGGSGLTSYNLDEAMERLRKNHYSLCKALKEAREDPTLLDRWRRAPKGSVEWRSLIFYEQALRVLAVALSV